MSLNKNIDPTHTQTLQNSYRVAMSKVFDHIIKTINISIGKNNCLRIGEFSYSKIDDSIPNLNKSAIDSTRFRFLDDAEKVIEFNNFVNELVTSELFGAARSAIGSNAISPGLQATITSPGIVTDAVSKMWFSNYVSLGYLNGMSAGSKALLKLKNLPADIRYVIENNTPKSLKKLLESKVHLSRLKLIYNRNYELLKGVTGDMSSHITRILSNGLASGTNPNVIAEELSKDLKTLTNHRATLIARTEMVRAHNHGAISAYEDAGLKEGLIQAEILTAGDGRVCPQCAPYNGKKMSLAKARSLFPLHPQCRCAILPYNPEWDED